MRWLVSLFGATPVRVSESAGGGIGLQVPLANSFDAGSNDPKPAVRAVLDRLTQSLLRQPRARLEISAPPPAARAAALRTYVARQGIAAWRVVLVGEPGQPESVGLRLLPGPAGVQRPDGALRPGGSALPKPALTAVQQLSPP